MCRKTQSAITTSDIDVRVRIDRKTAPKCLPGICEDLIPATAQTMGFVPSSFIERPRRKIFDGWIPVGTIISLFLSGV